MPEKHRGNLRTIYGQKEKKKSRNHKVSRFSFEYHRSDFGGDKRDRTADLLNAIQALSQLSYTPMYRNPLFFNGFRGSCIIKLCGIRGRSPVSLRSQLSYTPIFGFLTGCLRQLLYYSTPSGNVKHFFRVCRKFLKKLFRGRSGGQGRSSRPSKLASVRAFSQ